MELRQIQYLYAVVETGSFTRAAERCLVSLSAISQQVKALEAELGFEPLHRHGRNFSVTPAGELFSRKASALLSQLEDLRYEAEGVANGWATTLAVGYLNRYDGWEVGGGVRGTGALTHQRVRGTGAMTRPGFPLRRVEWDPCQYPSSGRSGGR